MKLFLHNKKTPPKKKRAPVAMPARRVKAQPTQSKRAWFSIDGSLIFITAAFMVFGLLFTYSSSAFDSASYFERQVVFNIMGLCGAVFLAKYYLKLQRKISPVYVIAGAWVLLVIVLFCPPVANVHRWINLKFFNLQPSEVAKPALLIYLAYYVSNISVNISKKFFSLVPPLAVTCVTLGLMMLAPELGAPVLMASVVFLILFVAGARIKHLLLVVAAAVPVLLYQLIFYSYRLGRVLSFLNPEAQAGGKGYQLLHSQMAVASGGWFGKGFGNSEIKPPAAHTDFIFSTIGEELGLIGVLFIIGLFVWLLAWGVRAALRAKDSFNSTLILGITLTITLQAFFNMGVAIGLLPTKGLPLPFFSYGGSSVIVTLCMMGILANLSAEENK